jgi:hypothetical protein
VIVQISQLHSTQHVQESQTRQSWRQEEARWWRSSRNAAWHGRSVAIDVQVGNAQRFVENSISRLRFVFFVFAGIPPEMMAAFGMGMGMDDEDFDDEDFDEEDLDSMEAEFASFGGGGGGGGRGSAKKEAKKSKRCHYEVLGIERDATTDQIKKAFRINAVKHHPDKGGDPELFKLMSEAYAVLSDDSKRARYDRYGHEDDGVCSCLL